MAEQPNPRNPEGLGVGALASGELQHGERPVVESMNQGGMGPPPAQGPAPGQAPGQPQDIFAPSEHPEQPITDGLPMGPGGSSPVLAEDPDEVLRVLYEAFPHDDIRQLLEGREF